MKNRTRAIGVAGALVLVLVGFLIWNVVRDDSEKQLGDNITQKPTTTMTQPPTTVPEEEPYSSLAAFLPTELDGYRIDTGAKATGSLDFEAAVAAESDTQAERALLETRKFQAGYARAFTDGETDVYMLVYEFVDDENAALYLTDGFITLYGKGASTYSVPDIPGGQGFSQGSGDAAGPTVIHGVAFAKGQKFVLVFTRSAETSTPVEAKRVALTLYPRA